MPHHLSVEQTRARYTKPNAKGRSQTCALGSWCNKTKKLSLLCFQALLSHLLGTFKVDSPVKPFMVPVTSHKRTFTFVVIQGWAPPRSLSFSMEFLGWCYAGWKANMISRGGRWAYSADAGGSQYSESLISLCLSYFLLDEQAHTLCYFWTWCLFWYPN